MFDPLISEINEIQRDGVDVNLAFSSGDYFKIALSLFVGLLAAMVVAHVITKRM